MLQLCGCGNEIGWQAHKVVALARSNNDIVLQAWSLPSGRTQPNPPVLNTDQANAGAVLSGDGTLAATWSEMQPQPTVQVQDTGTQVAPSSPCRRRRCIAGVELQP